jgi:hypothetical protein
MQIFEGIPRLAIIAVLILALIGAVWFWRRWKSSSSTDKELTENVKAQQHAAVYAKNVAKGLQDYEDDAEHTSGATDEYTTEVAQGLQDHEDEDDLEDDEEYEPMD